jgi:serine/threonine protein kinase
VVEAWDRVANRPVAIKKIHKEALYHPYECTKIAREIIIAKSLRGQPDFAQLRTILTPFPEMNNTLSTLYLVFELYRCDLFHYLCHISPCRLQPSDARRIMFELLRGLAAMHTMGAIHRDVKPSNILLSKSGKVHLCDLGLARTAERTHDFEHEAIACAPAVPLTTCVGTMW